MKKHRPYFLIIVSIVWLLVNYSSVFVFRQIFYLTNNVVFTWMWGAFSILAFTPIFVAPVDRGRTMGFLTRHLPLFLVLIWIGWILSQFFMLLIFPVFWLVPPGGKSYDYFPLILALLFQAIVFKSVFRVSRNEVEFKIPHLPENWKPLKILHISDIHSGPFMQYGHFEKLVARFNNEKFDLCVVTGDVVNHSAAEISWTLELLQKIKSPLGIFASMGNHEYIDDEKRIIDSYSQSKINLLIGDSKIVESDGRKIRIIGVDYPFETKVTGEKEIGDALSKSLAENPKTQGELEVLLSHHPEGFEAAARLGIAVTLAGHTHGGQIEVFRKNTLGRFTDYIRGVYQKNSSFMYVNSGLGNWMPFRINVPCEYVLITVERSQ